MTKRRRQPVVNQEGTIEVVIYADTSATRRALRLAEIPAWAFYGTYCGPGPTPAASSSSSEKL